MCIFARRLSEILDARGKRIGSLHMVIVYERNGQKVGIPPVQIMRLQQAANGDCTMTVTLSPEQLEAVRNKFNLDDEEMRQLKAALLAEFELRLLLDRIPPGPAVRMASNIFQMLLDARTLDAFDVDLDDMRGEVDDELLDELSSPLAVLEQRFHSDLEPVTQAYDEAVLWLNRAYEAQDPARRRMYAGLTSSLLAHASAFLASLSLPTEAAPLSDAWNSYIEQTRLEVSALGYGRTE